VQAEKGKKIGGPSQPTFALFVFEHDKNGKQRPYRVDGTYFVTKQMENWPNVEASQKAP